MKARLKAKPIDAWQNNNNSFVPVWVANCCQYNEQEELFLIRRSGKQLVKNGEWIIRNLDGDPIWMTDEEFKETYEVVG